MKICAVTVTYGDRAAFCIKISENAFFQGIHEMIIVDNGSVVESREQLAQFVHEHPSVKLVSLKSNMGSAKGFAEGIKAFLETDCNFLLLLDDDNLVCQGAVSTMIGFWNAATGIEKEGNLALSAFRKDRANMIRALRTGEPDYILPAKNSFMGFHIRLVWLMIRQRIKPDPKHLEATREILEIPATSYGGLWMHRSLCIRTGLPDEDYVLYMDDFDYTGRITQLGGKIVLLRNCMIQDIHESYYLPGKKKWLYHSLLNAPNDSITYYTCRNIVLYCRKNRVTHLLLYRLNRLLYFTAVIFLAVLSNKLSKLKIIFRAVRDAESSCMGYKPKFPL